MRQRWLKLEDQLIIQTFQTVLELVSLKMIDTYCICCINYQLSRKGDRYGFNVPNRYLKTKKKYGHDKKIFYGLGKVQYLKNLRIALECFQVC